MQISKIFRPGKKKIILLIILILGVVVAFNYFSQKKHTKLQFAAVKRQNIKSTVSASGILNGNAVANLKFKSSGKLSWINVKVGDRVTTGQAIAGLDTQDLAISVIAKADNVLTIPTESIKEDNTVTINTPDGLKTVPVTQGIKSDTDTEIKSGLVENQQGHTIVLITHEHNVAQRAKRIIQIKDGEIK